MKLIDKLENKDKIKKALEIEINNNYINIVGKTKPFANFMMAEIKKIIKLMPKNEKWRNMYQTFNNYQLLMLSERIKAINSFCELLSENYVEYMPEEKNKKTYSNNPEETDVTYCKGVGPKIAEILNKLKIFTVMDLLTYYPSKHLDYTQRTKIKNIKEGDNVTIFGEIRDVNIFNSPNKNMCILTIVVTDGTGKIKSTWFYKKLNRKMMEHYKAHYPVGSNII